METTWILHVSTKLRGWQRQGQDWYIHANDSEWLLHLERNYPNIVFPQNCYHPHFTNNTTCGELLMQHFMDWWNAINTTTFLDNHSSRNSVFMH